MINRFPDWDKAELHANSTKVGKTKQLSQDIGLNRNSLPMLQSGSRQGTGCYLRQHERTLVYRHWFSFILGILQVLHHLSVISDFKH